LSYSHRAVPILFHNCWAALFSLSLARSTQVQLKVSNETKIGALTAVSITLLIIGFNLLKGRTLFSHHMTIYAIYSKVDGLAQADGVQVSGLTVGTVSGLTVMDRNVGKILVQMVIKKDINIPKNSVASIINADLLGTKVVRIDFGDSPEYLTQDDTIQSRVEGSVTEKLMDNLQPVTSQIKYSLVRLDSVLSTLYSTFDPSTRNNLKSTIANLSITMKQFSRTAVSTDLLVRNLDSISENLKDNSGNITSILQNTRKIVTDVSGAKLDTTLIEMSQAMASLDLILSRITKSQGSLGLLVNDKKLYENLQASSLNLNRLLEDLRLNPKRYVHFSLFGKKDKNNPLPADSLSRQ